MQGALRAGVSLFMLSGACVLSAQTPEEGAEVEADYTESSQPVAKKAVAPQYKMKEVSGYVYDAATKKPLAGVKVQALNNRFYSALTEDDGKYTINVPEFVDVLFINIQDYNTAQLALKGAANQNVYLNKGMKKDFYFDGTSMNNNQTAWLNEPNALTVEEEIEKELGGSVRTINRGGMPAQGAAMFINGLNSLNTNAQHLVIVDGVMMDLQYDRTQLHQGFVNNVFNIIDPDDIESVEVVKNGTALYGAKGANGVLLINTRRGKSMVTRINIRAYGGFETAPEQMQMMNASQYRNYFTEVVGTVPDTKLISSSMSMPYFNEDPNYIYYNLYHNDTDWQKDLYHDVFTQHYKVSVDGGDDVAVYHLSLGYSEADATAKCNDFNRLNIRFNTDVNMFKNFVTGMDFSYSRNAYNMRDNGWAADYSQRNISSPNVLGLIQSPSLSPYAHYVRYTQGTGLELVSTDRVYSGKEYTDQTNPFRYVETYGFDALVNPYWVLLNGQGNNKNYYEQTQFNLNISPSYQINKNLVIKDRFSYILNRNNEKYYLPKNGTPSKYVEGLGDVTSIVSTQFGKETTLFNDLSLQWKKNFGSHDLNVLGGFRYASYPYKASNITG